MRKIFSFLAAAAMLFTASCSNDDLGTDNGNEAQVTFNLGLEGQAGTRAIGDGSGVTKLYYYIFDAAGNRLKSYDYTDEVFSTVTPQIKLAKDQTYTAVFWAQKETTAYEVVAADDEKGDVQVKVTYGNANDEARDAFFGKKEFTVTGSGRIDVILKRPFTQLNVGVTKEDYDAAVASGVTIAKSWAKVEKVYNTLNLLSGEATGEVDAEFALDERPKQDLGVDLNGDGEVKSEDNETFAYLSMNYILVGNRKNVKASFRFENENGLKTIAFNSGLDAVPVERNFRTNLIGQILTGNLDFEVKIDAGFAGEENVNVPCAIINNTRYATFADAMAAVNDGETIVLLGDSELEGVANAALFSIKDKAITIDLNGFSIVANIPDVTKNSSIFRVENNSGLTIQGNGYIKFSTAKAINCLAAFIDNNGGVVNLKGGIWTINAMDSWQDALIPTFVDNNSNTNNATLNIHGGTYTFHRNLFRNFANAAGHNNYATVATMNIYGGTFNGREDDKGTIWNQRPAATVPDGAGVINVYGGEFNNVEINDEFSGVAYANNQEQLNAALQNVNTHTIMLGAGEFKADLYNGTPARKSLTIVGTEGTKFGHTATTGGQLRLDLFENFTIKNCEIIQRSGYKTWGMLVFGGSNKADGVYTVSNCTFNGVGTQGIYINETVSGATYNIEDCTFNGDFGGEGAITIQGNQNVECNVNVNGCTFDNIPDTSHRIFVTNNPTIYYDFKLNTDLQATTAYEIYMFVKLGFETINLADGEYDVYGCGGKTLTLNGSKNAVLILKNDGEDGCDYAFGDGGTGVGNITFNGLTINTTQNTGNYKGYAYMKGTFNNCDFVGAYSLNNANDFTFNACTFDFKGGYFWTWGANSVKFDGCTFNGDSRNILAHGGASTKITINNCNFAATVVGKTGAGDPTACVEIDPIGSNTYTINFTGTNTKSDKYAGWTRIKDGSTGHTITGAE